MLFTEEAIHYIYFQILIRLHSEWFTTRVYDCFELFFMRINQDCKFINHNHGGAGGGTYELVNVELIGFNKLWYIYFKGEDCKVVKKSKEFLTKIVSKFDYNEKVGQSIKEKYINILIENMKSSYETISTSPTTNTTT